MHPQTVVWMTRTDYELVKVPGRPGNHNTNELETMVETTVDGGNPASPGMYKTLVNNGIHSISTGEFTGFLNRQMVAPLDTEKG